MGKFFSDLRHGLRLLLSQPAFALVAIVTLALGIGANTALFSVINGVLLHPLPYGEPDRLALVYETRGDDFSRSTSMAGLRDWREQSQSFESLAAYFPIPMTLTGVDVPERVDGLQVTPNFFQVLGVGAALGRTFAEDAGEEEGRIIVLTNEFWQRRFGSDPSIINRAVALDGIRHTVIGVMPDGFQFALRKSDLFIRPPQGIPRPPIDLPPEINLAEFRDLNWLDVLGRLKVGESLEDADAEMKVIAQRLAEEYPDSNAETSARVISLREQVVGDVRPALLVLLGAVGFVLLIACANVANLLLARATGREREIAIRASLGAGRLRIIGQLVAESLVLAVVGGAAGLLVAFWSTELILAISPKVLPRISLVELDLRVLAFTFVISILTGLVFGLLPALQVSKTNLRDALREGGRTGSGTRQRRLRAGLVVLELGLAMVLLIGAGLLIRSFFLMLDVHPGFNPKNVLTAVLWLPESKYSEDEEIASVYARVLERVKTTPGVRSASAVLGVPLGGASARFGFAIEGRPEPPPGQELRAGFQPVSPDYFRTMEIPLRAGRDIQDGDHADASQVAVINETMKRRYWPDEDAVGKRISYDDETWVEIVGIVGDIRFEGLDRDPRPEIYLPYMQAPLQAPLRFMTLAIRTETDPLDLVSSVRNQVLGVDPDLPVFKVMSMEQLLGDSVAQPRFNMYLFGVFAATALLLAGVGIYGLMSYTVGLRTHEIGIRMAMGARVNDVLGLVVRQGMVLALVGLGLGLCVAWGLTRVLSTFLYGVTTTDPLTFIAVSVLLSLVALAAIFIPAYRATRLDPLTALRYE
jgi:putative ABC transport system permease protein